MILLQDGDVWVGVFPEGEEIFVGGERPAVVVRIADRFVARQVKIFPHYRERRDGRMIASILEVKKEIPV